MSDLYVIIANWGRGQQTLYPRNDTRADRPGFGNPDKERPGMLVGVYTEAEADSILAELSPGSTPWHRGDGSPHYHKKPLRDAHKYAQGLAGNLISQVQQDMLRENKMIKMKKSQLAKIIREAQWGAFEHGAAPLDEPPLDSGPMSPEMQQRVFDMLVDSGSDPKVLMASGDYPDVDRMMEESVDEKTYDDLVAMLGDVASPGWIKWNLEDGLTKDEIIARAKEGEERSRAHMRDEDEYARPDYEGGEDRGLAAREYTVGHDGPNPPSAFPIRVGWDGGSYDAVDDEDLEMITRDLVSKGIAYSVDSVSDMEPEAVSVGADIEQFSEGFESLQAGKLRIKKSELTRLIREAFDVINAETGEINDMAPDADAVFNIMKRLGIAPDKAEGMPGAEEVWLSGDDWYRFYDETEGKRYNRKEKARIKQLDQEIADDAREEQERLSRKAKSLDPNLLKGALPGKYWDQRRRSKYEGKTIKIRKSELRKLLREAQHGQAMQPWEFQEKIEWGEWPGRPPNFEWNYVEQESGQDLRFDWRGGSMWYRAYSPPGEVEGNIPKHLIPYLKKMGLGVYPE